MAIKAKIRYPDGSGVPSNPGDQAKSHQHPASSVQPVESDAKHTGGDLDKQRDALRKNIEEGAREQHSELPAGQHATGSFTGAAPTEPAKRPKRNGNR